jgi:hypothetical protein
VPAVLTTGAPLAAAISGHSQQVVALLAWRLIHLRIRSITVFYVFLT